ncbi:MAG: hypothetical protein IMF20_03025 [Proteobacteria bacterium]|nr:hypothetical protein [Pseudomonadota bacterium]
MFKEKTLECPWEEFEKIIRKELGPGFMWKIRPGDIGPRAVLNCIGI